MASEAAGDAAPAKKVQRIDETTGDETRMPRDNNCITSTFKSLPSFDADMLALHGRRVGSSGRTAEGPSDSLPVLNYAVGEPLDFLKYFNAGKLGEGKIPGHGRTVKVVIPGDCLGNMNRQVQGRQLWGTDVYTYDSDLVAVLVHAGYYSHILSGPPPGITEAHVVVALSAVEPQYLSKSRHNIRSRSWCGKLEGCSIRVEGCWLKSESGLIELNAAPEGIPALAPSFMPAGTERIMHTRNALNDARRQRFKLEMSIQYNLCNEPWVKYTMGAIADQGLQPAHWTSARLHTQVLYLETQKTRFEISRQEGNQSSASASSGEAAAASFQDASSANEEKYCWARCIEPLPLSQMRKAGVPLPAGRVQVIERDLEWEDFKWSPSAVYVLGVRYAILRCQFIRIIKSDKESA
jgi:hypothetical protein